jgi:hypothetical protein
MMRQLDSDGSVLRASNGQPAVRDLVQFVKFKEYQTIDRLAEEVLREIPS